MLSRVTGGLCKSKRQNLIRICFRDYCPQSRLTIIEESLSGFECFFGVILGQGSAELATDSDMSSQ